VREQWLEIAGAKALHVLTSTNSPLDHRIPAALQRRCGLAALAIGCLALGPASFLPS